MSKIQGATVKITPSGVLLSIAQWVLLVLAVVGYLGNMNTDQASYATLGAVLFVVVALTLEGIKRKVGYALTVNTVDGAVKAAKGSEREMRQMHGTLLNGLRATRSTQQAS